MKRLIPLLAIAAALVVPALLVPAVGFAQTVTFSVGAEAPYAPPAPRVVHHVAAPAPGYVWVPGQWMWQGNQWVWSDGYWIQDRPGYVVVQPQWVQDRGHWVYRPGGWARRGTRQVAYQFDTGRRWRGHVRPAPVYQPRPRVVVQPRPVYRPAPPRARVYARPAPRARVDYRPRGRVEARSPRGGGGRVTVRPR